MYSRARGRNRQIDRQTETERERLKPAYTLGYLESTRVVNQNYLGHKQLISSYWASELPGSSTSWLVCCSLHHCFINHISQLCTGDSIKVALQQLQSPTEPSHSTSSQKDTQVSTRLLHPNSAISFQIPYIAKQRPPLC